MRRSFAALCAGALIAVTGGAARAQQPAGAGQGEEAAPIALPDLHFTPTPHVAENYDKYYFFHRPDTDFETAYADLRECDGYARGLSVRTGGGSVPYPYANTMAGAIGGVIGDAMVAAIIGSAERRRLRRINMRACMDFKGYTAFGLPKEIWEQFNFEEGLGQVEEARRQQFLRAQARAASGPRPTVGEIGR